MVAHRTCSTTSTSGAPAGHGAVYLLAEAIDTAGAELAVHGHAHMGTEHGMTAGGVRVRNVAQSVIRRAFNVYDLHTADDRVG